MTQPTPVVPVAPEVGPAGAILDYASPGLKKKLRLPSRSVLTFHVRDHELAVVEAVQAKDSAVAALAFAGFVLAWLAFIMVVSFRHGLYTVLGPLWLIEFALLLLVVHDTWRTTTLTVTPAGLDLRFATPFRKRSYHWPATDFRHVLAYATDVSKSPPLGLLTLSLGPSTVRLFDGHDHNQLAWLAAAIEQALLPASSIPQSAIPNSQ